jgi:hypothetical protein
VVLELKNSPIMSNMSKEAVSECPRVEIFEFLVVTDLVVNL